MSSAEGLIVPLATPMVRGQVDWASLERLASAVARHGASVFTASTTGEGPLLSWEEKVEAVRRAAEAGARVWGGTALTSAEETARLARDLVDAGAVGVVVVTPHYYRVSQEALYSYYSYVLSRVDAPVIAYTIPDSTCNLLEPETAERLAEEHSNLVGVKVTSGDASLLLRMIIALRGTQAIVLPGNVALLPLALAHGTRGAILAVGNILPRTAVSVLGDETPKWRREYVKLARAASYLEKGPGPCTVKRVLSTAGIIGGAGCRGHLGMETVPEPPRWLVEEAREELS